MTQKNAGHSELATYLSENGDGSLAPYIEPKPETPPEPENLGPELTPAAGKLDRPEPAPASIPSHPGGAGAGRPGSPGGRGSAEFQTQERRQDQETGVIVRPGTSTAISLTSALGMQPGQRGATEKAQESGSAVLAKNLGPQLGTAPEFLVHLQIDERKLAVLNDMQSTALVYLYFRGWVDKCRFWQWFVDGELVTSQAIGGLARRHILKALEAGSGQQIEEIKRPGLLARNIWSRDWEKNAQRRGNLTQEPEE